MIAQKTLLNDPVGMTFIAFMASFAVATLGTLIIGYIILNTPSNLIDACYIDGQRFIYIEDRNGAKSYDGYSYFRLHNEDGKCASDRLEPNTLYHAKNDITFTTNESGYVVPNASWSESQFKYAHILDAYFNSGWWLVGIPVMVGISCFITYLVSKRHISKKPFYGQLGFDI